MDLASLADFLAVVEAGSISAGARRRGRPKQSVSRRIMTLESTLGVRLFERTTRALHLTADGEFLRDRATALLANLEEARLALSERAIEAIGPLRLSCPTLLGHTIVGGIAAKALARHPRLTLEIILTDRRVSLVEEGFDAAIRVGSVAESALTSVPLTEAETVLVAAPGLPGCAADASPAQVASLPRIAFGESRDCASWQFERGGERVLISSAPSLVSSSHSLNLEAALAGGGVAQVPAFIARSALSAGRLVRLLSDWHGGSVPIRLVYPSRRLESARLRAFIEVATREFGESDFRLSD